MKIVIETQPRERTATIEIDGKSVIARETETGFSMDARHLPEGSAAREFCAGVLFDVGTKLINIEEFLNGGDWWEPLTEDELEFIEDELA